jgi:large subunit ribosomal protein L15
MKYNELQVDANKSRKRVGRGISAGGGKTAGRGTKGQGARTGKKLAPTFAGGQRSLVAAVPKARGFKSRRTPAQVVYLDTLNALKGKTIDNFVLYEEGYVETPFHTVKVIVRGEITEKVTLHIANISKTAEAAVIKAGGTYVKTPVPLRQSTKEAEAADTAK